MSTQLKSGILEVVRTVLLAIIPIIIYHINTILPGVTGAYRIDILMGVIAILKGVDEYLTQNGLGINRSGLTGF